MLLKKKVAVVSILFIYAVMCVSCNTLPKVGITDSSEKITSKQTTVAFPLVDEKFGYLDFLPLPTNYSSVYFLNERVFTGEVYSKDPTSSLSSLLLDGFLLVPKDYHTIIETTFYQTLISKNFQLKKYASLEDAKSDGCTMLILGVPQAFHVENETKAHVNIHYRVYKLPQETILWEGSLSNQFIHNDIPSSLSRKTLIFMPGMHQFNFQPQRAILAYAVYDNTINLLSKLEESMGKNKQ